MRWKETYRKKEKRRERLMMCDFRRDKRIVTYTHTGDKIKSRSGGDKIKSRSGHKTRQLIYSATHES
jgi:hypothetical protein